MRKVFLQVGDIVHAESSTADSPNLCYPAILGGQVSDHWWVLTLNFAGPRIAWLGDTKWHPKDGCTTDSGKIQSVSYIPTVTL